MPKTARGRLPRWCPKCASDRHRSQGTESKRRTQRYPCRVNKCDDCGRFIEILTRPGKARLRCVKCDRDRRIAKQAEYRKTHPHRLKANRTRFVERHPERIKANSARQGAARREAPTFRVTEKEFRRLRSMPCAYCGAPSEHIDHVTPLARGGRHSIGNLVGACAACNLSKSKKLLVEWRYQQKKEDSAMLYRVSEEMSVWVEGLGRDVRLHAGQELDDQNADDAAIIKEWAPRGLLRAPNIESATAAPGEVRSTRRKPAA